MTPIIKAKTYALIRRHHEILLEAVIEDGAVKGYRPLGGTIEFQESAVHGVAREIKEELGEDVTVGPLFCVSEEIFTYNGASHHEVAFIHDCAFVNQAVYHSETIERIDTAHGIRIQAQWLDPLNLPDGAPLFPTDLAVALKRE